jgi:L-asparaginase
MELYETGVRLQKIGVISGHDMTTEAAVTKLMWLLGETLSGEEVARRMIQPLRGEFHA